MIWPAFLTLVLLAGLGVGVAAAPPSAPDFAAGATALDEAITRDYAYLEKLPGGLLPQSSLLARERKEVHDRSSLLRYAEDRMQSLADHHAITGASFNDSWAVVPTYADLWIEPDGGRFRVDSVRAGTPAQRAGVRAGEWLVSVDGVATAQAVEAFWRNIGLTVTPRRADYGARVVAAGRRDRGRTLGIMGPDGKVRILALPSLYREPALDRGPVTRSAEGDRVVIRLNNSLGDGATIAAFDQAMASLRPYHRVTIDLRDTPSGGTSSVARAVMAWFVTKPTSFQLHNQPAEERETGVARQWIEQVLPRAGKYHRSLPDVLVGRWTGSMGEGIAIGFDAMGAKVRGGPMAGLNGSVDDEPLGATGLIVKLPTERLFTVAGQAREDFRPRR